MTNRSNDQIEELFAAALKQPAPQRTSFITEACSGDDALASRVRRLLESHEHVEAMLPDPEAIELSNHDDSLAEALLASPAEDGGASRLIGQTFDGFRIVCLLGEGGMGAVFEATQDTPARTVAMKVLRPGIASRSMLRRFEFEAEVLGRLRHPGIAQIHQVGMYDDGAGASPYFVMEYVAEARSITRYADEAGLETSTRLTLFAQVCDAVHHGHQHGIIHRDLKPANILVDAAGRPKIIDFGVARSTDSDLTAATMHTHAGDLVGTVLYMSPEQIDGDPREIDTRTDVYSLGVILYELLSGSLPYELEHKSLAESARVIRESLPSRIGALRREFRGDIQTILDRCLEKDPSQRYPSTAELAEDIRRHLRCEPIMAAPPSIRYRASRFIRRNPLLVSAIAMVTATLFIGVTATTWGWREALAANIRTTAESERRQRALDFVVELLRTPAPGETGANVRVVEALSEAESKISASFEDDPQLELAIRNVLGEVLFGLGLYEQAEAHYARAIDLSEKLHGAISVERSAALGGQGTALSQLNRLDEAEHMLRKALEVRAEVFAAADDDQARLMGQLATTLELQRQYDEAEALLLEAQAISTPEGVARMEILTGLGVVAFRLEQLEKAIDLSEQAYELAVLHRGLAHPDTISLVSNIAFFRGKQGDHEGEIGVYREVIETARDQFGQTHPMLAQLLVNLGDAHVSAGRTEEAQHNYEEAIDIRRVRFGDTHIATTEARYKLAYVLQGLDLPRSAELLKQVAGGYLRHYGPESWEYRLLLLNLGRTLGNLSAHLESETYFREAYEGTLHADLPDQIHFFLGDYLDARIRNHRFDKETERLCHELDQVLSRQAANPEEAARQRAQHLVLVLSRQQRFEEAIADAEAMIETLQSFEVDVSTWRVGLGMTLLDDGRLDDAVRQADLLKDATLEDVLSQSQLVAFRGFVRLAEGDPAGAETLLRQAFELRSPDHSVFIIPTTGRIKFGLGIALIGLDRSAEAAPWLDDGLDHLSVAWGEDDWLVMRLRRQAEASMSSD